jgi:hypothetical protein
MLHISILSRWAAEMRVRLTRLRVLPLLCQQLGNQLFDALQFLVQ